MILKIPKESVPSDVDQHVDSLLVNILVVGANVLVILLVVGMLIFILCAGFCCRFSVNGCHLRLLCYGFLH